MNQNKLQTTTQNSDYYGKRVIFGLTLFFTILYGSLIFGYDSYITSGYADPSFTFKAYLLTIVIAIFGIWIAYFTVTKLNSYVGDIVGIAAGVIFGIPILVIVYTVLLIIRFIRSKQS